MRDAAAAPACWNAPARVINPLFIRAAQVRPSRQLVGRPVEGDEMKARIALVSDPDGNQIGIEQLHPHREGEV